MSPNISETTLCFCTSFCKPIVCHRKNKHIPGTWSLGIPNLLSPVSDHHLQNGLAPIFGREPNKLLTEICIQEVHHTGPWCSRPLRKAWLSQLWDKAIGYPWISIRDISPSFGSIWLVKHTGWWFQLLWKIWKSLGIIIPNIWKNKIHVPNHQPAQDFVGWSPMAGQSPLGRRTQLKLKSSAAMLSLDISCRPTSAWDQQVMSGNLPSSGLFEI